MEWITTVLTALGLLILLAPLLMVLVTAFVLVPLAHLTTSGPTVARASFDCPFARKHVHATFLVPPGADRATDVLACSVFGDGPVGCRKGCLQLAGTHAEPNAVTPRYALLADGESYRDAA
jgi:hypothetical protein